MRFKTTPAVAEATGICENALRKYAARLDLPKIGTAYAWTADDIQKALAMRDEGVRTGRRVAAIIHQRGHNAAH